MSRPVFDPGDGGVPATQDVAALIAAVPLPFIERFGPDNSLLAGLPAYIAHPVPVPEPASWVSVAREVQGSAVAALAAVKVLESRTAALKAALITRHLAAAQVEATALALDPWQSGMAESSAVAEIATTLALPEGTAKALANQSTELVTGHPDTFNALDAGALTWRHASIIIDESRTLAETPQMKPAELAAFETRLLAAAPGTTGGCFASKARRLREGTHPESLTTRVRQAIAKRSLTVERGKDGMSWLTLHLPAPAANGALAQCTRLARAQQGPNEHRTLSQLRADTATILLLGQPLPTTTNHATPGTTGTTTDAGTSTGTGTTTAPTAGAGTGTGRAVGTTTAPTDSTLDGATVDTNATTGGFTGSIAGTGAMDSGQPLAGGPDLQPWTLTSDTTGATTSPGRDDGPYLWPWLPADDTATGAATQGANHSGSGGDGEGTVGELIRGLAGTVEDGVVDAVVDGILDGVVEDPRKEYLDQLDATWNGKAITEPPLPTAQVIITVPALGLLGITNEPAQLAGHGPIPEETARKLLLNAGTFLRVLTDPVTNTPLKDVPPERYRLKKSEKTLLQALNETCSFPNCTNPAIDTETDHLTAYARGGKTTLGNSHPLCRRHHALKHFRDDKDRHGHYRQDLDPERAGIKLRGWKPTATSDGRIGWTSPTGTYHPPTQRTTQPPAYPKWVKKHLTKNHNQHLTNPDTSTETVPDSSTGTGTAAAMGTLPGTTSPRFDLSHSPLEQLIEYTTKRHTQND